MFCDGPMNCIGWRVGALSLISKSKASHSPCRTQEGRIPRSLHHAYRMLMYKFDKSSYYKNLLLQRGDGVVACVSWLRWWVLVCVCQRLSQRRRGRHVSHSICDRDYGEQVDEACAILPVIDYARLTLFVCHKAPLEVGNGFWVCMPP